MKTCLSALGLLLCLLVPATAQKAPPSAFESLSIFNVKAYGATGDGRTYDDAAINTASRAVKAAGGGTLYFPCGTYLLSTAVHVYSDTKVLGAGDCAVLRARESGWPMPTTEVFGILTVRNAANVEITSVKLHGTRTAPFNQTPKLVYYETVDNLRIHHAFLYNSSVEGIWGGGKQELSTNGSISNNYIREVGYPNSYGGLPAIQINGFGWIVDGNILIDTGTAIGASGQSTIISNNFIDGVVVTGIGTGDGAQPNMIDIIGNTVIFDPSGHSASGIRLDDGGGDKFTAPKSYVNVQGNNIRTTKPPGPGFYSICVYGTGAPFVMLNGNYCEITERGNGFQLYGSPKGITYNITGNTVRFINQAPNASMGGIGAIPNGPGNSVSVTSANNSVVGLTSSGGSFAYRYFTPNGGTFKALVAMGDWSEGGNVGLGPYEFLAGEYRNKPIFIDAVNRIGVPVQINPTLSFGRDGAGMLGSLTGSYTRSFSGQVSLSFTLSLASQSGASRPLEIGGLPVEASALSETPLTCHRAERFANIGGGVTALLSGTTLRLYRQDASGTVALTRENLTGASTLTCAGTFQAAMP